LPLAFVGFVTTVYYLAIENIPQLQIVFPSFFSFIVVCTLLVPPLGVFLGWLFMKGKLSRFYKAELDIQVEASPYSRIYSDPKGLIALRIYHELAKKLEVDPEIMADLGELIRLTEEKWHLKGKKVTEVNG
jgi:hypothetical protein